MFVSLVNRELASQPFTLLPQGQSVNGAECSIAPSECDILNGNGISTAQAGSSYQMVQGNRLLHGGSQQYSAPKPQQNSRSRDKGDVSNVSNSRQYTIPQRFSGPEGNGTSNRPTKTAVRRGSATGSQRGRRQTQVDESHVVTSSKRPVETDFLRQNDPSMLFHPISDVDESGLAIKRVATDFENVSDQFVVPCHQQQISYEQQQVASMHGMQWSAAQKQQAIATGISPTPLLFRQCLDSPLSTVSPITPTTELLKDVTMPHGQAPVFTGPADLSPFLRLSPPPTDRDYMFNLDDLEGIQELFDIPMSQQT